MSAYVRDEVRASKRERVCVECLVTIYVGETYKHTYHLDRGRGQRFATCMPCSEQYEHQIQEVLDSHLDEPPHIGGLWASVDEEEYL